MIGKRIPAASREMKSFIGTGSDSFAGNSSSEKRAVVYSGDLFLIVRKIAGGKIALKC